MSAITFKRARSGGLRGPSVVGPPGEAEAATRLSVLSDPATDNTGRRWLEVDGGGDVLFTGYSRNVVGFSGLTDPPDDFVAGLGFNMEAGSRLDDDKPGLALAFENAFKNPGDTSTAGYFEQHLEVFYIDNTGRRVWSHSIPRVLGDGVQGSTYENGIITWLAFDDRSQKVQWSFDGPNAGLLDYASGLYKRFAGNNEVVLTQTNAAGDGFPGMKITNARDETEFQNTLYLGGGLKDNLYGDRAAITANIDTPVEGDRMIDIRSGEAGSGNIKAFNFDLYADLVEGYMRNKSGPARYTVQAATGDAWITFVVNGASFSIGADLPGERLTIGKGADLSDPLVTVDYATGQTAFVKPPKLPSFTVATLPSASAAGAGAMIFVTDESGGAVPAFSDATNWRRYTDRNIVS